MNFEFTLDTLPFIASIVLDAISPKTSKRIENIVDQKLEKEKATEKQRSAIQDYISYSSDSLLVISAIIISIVSVISIPFFKNNEIIGIVIMGILGILLILSIHYFSRTDPYNHAIMRFGPYGWVSWCTMGMNVTLIILLTYKA